MLETKEYHRVVSKMRDFFVKRGFVEVPVQSRLSILAACEDPTTISQFRFGGEVWPLPQTGQMWLEYELLKHPELVGVFCISTSYRDEKNPIPGRHDKIFPMFEFEGRGDLNDLINLERELLAHLDFTSSAKQLNYQQVAKFYGTEVLEAGHETNMATDFSPILFLTNFPFVTHPFWNMKHQGNEIFAKVDAILHGMETIGGAERSCNAEEMRQNFYSVSEGQYAQKLFDLFSREQVEAELNQYLALPMTPRFGAGIGITRMVRAMKKEGIMQENLVAVC
ncbi:MAG: amino acid--tRNA ligase-related protein [Patescibacteria group bacterium]